MIEQLAAMQKTLDQILARDEALRATNFELSTENKVLKNENSGLRRTMTNRARGQKANGRKK